MNIKLFQETAKTLIPKVSINDVNQHVTIIPIDDNWSVEISMWDQMKHIPKEIEAVVIYNPNNKRRKRYIMCANKTSDEIGWIIRGPCRMW
jgi:hypothetical protein